MELLAKFVPESIFSVFINLRLFIIFFFFLYYFIYLYFIYIFISVLIISVLMLYHTAFYELIHRPYIHIGIIYHWYFCSLFLSSFHLSTSLYFCFTAHNKISFFMEKISVATTIWAIHPYSDCFLGSWQYEAISWLLIYMVTKFIVGVSLFFF